MIYDPHDINIAMDNQGRLYYRTGSNHPSQGPMWRRLEEIRPNGDFRRPDW